LKYTANKLFINGQNKKGANTFTLGETPFLIYTPKEFLELNIFGAVQKTISPSKKVTSIPVKTNTLKRSGIVYFVVFKIIIYKFSVASFADSWDAFYHQAVEIHKYSVQEDIPTEEPTMDPFSSEGGNPTMDPFSSVDGDPTLEVLIFTYIIE
jgi:hypothetical protein